MFACLYVPPSSAMRGAPASADEAPDVRALLDVARMVSPRVAVRSRHQIVIDVEGLERLVGDPKAIGERLRQAAADRGIVPVHVAVAGTCTAAMLLAAARAGVTVAAEGKEAEALAPLPLRTLAVLASEGIEARSKKQEARRSPSPDSLAVLARWGLRTLGELAALPAADLSERLGQDGIRWQRLARGEDTGPLVPAPEEEPFEASLELEWPIGDLEPLSFVLTRLLDPLCQRLDQRDRGAAALHLRLRLVTRDLHLRSLQLPAPMRDPKVLRTLLLLDLESHPAPAGIDAVTLSIDPTPGRIVQESLLARALPAPELISTLVARLQALMGEGKCGSPVTVDSYRPGAFAMRPFVVHQDEGRSQKSEDRRQKTEGRKLDGGRGFPGLSGVEGSPGGLVEAKASTSILNPESRTPSPEPRVPSACLRRLRLPIPARVLIDGERPISVRTDRPALAGGRVHASAGPWRTSGEWWRTAAAAGTAASVAAGAAAPSAPPRRAGWNRDEWDVALSDGGLYRIFEDRDTGRWFVEAVVD